MKNKQKDIPKSRRSAQLASAIIMMVVGSVVLIGGFMLPPQGEIHPSVLVAFGEILTFVGALFGIDYRYRDTTN